MLARFLPIRKTFALQVAFGLIFCSGASDRLTANELSLATNSVQQQRFAILKNDSSSLSRLFEHDYPKWQQCQTAAKELITKNTTSNLSAREKLKQLLILLHHYLLDQAEFDPTCYDLRKTLTGHSYNCITASYLFSVLANNVGLKTNCMLNKDHVFVECKSTDTANRRQHTIYWIEATKAEGVVLLKNSLLPTFTARALNEKQIIAALLHNKAIVHHRSGQFDKAANFAMKAASLDPGNMLAQENLATIFNHWGIALYRQQQTELAERLLKAAELILSE